MILLALIMLVPLVVGLSYAFRDITLLDPDSGGYVGSTISASSGRTRASGTPSATPSRGPCRRSCCNSRSARAGAAARSTVSRPCRHSGAGVLPWAVPSFLSGLDWAWLFNPVIGPLPHWFVALGLMAEPQNLLSSPDHAIWGPVIANVWWGIPFFAITLLAALQAIPKDLYEAAALDGAKAIERFRFITLPFLAPTIAITVMLRTVWIANFADLIVVMTRGGPADSTQILASYIFTQAFQRLDFGYASAIAAVMLVLLLAYAALLVVLRQTLLART